MALIAGCLPDVFFKRCVEGALNLQLEYPPGTIRRIDKRDFLRFLIAC